MKFLLDANKQLYHALVELGTVVNDEYVGNYLHLPHWFKLDTETGKLELIATEDLPEVVNEYIKETADKNDSKNAD